MSFFSSLGFSSPTLDLSSFLLSSSAYANFFSIMEASPTLFALGASPTLASPSFFFSSN
jgi:hypothetical protein